MAWGARLVGALLLAGCAADNPAFMAGGPREGGSSDDGLLDDDDDNDDDDDDDDDGDDDDDAEEVCLEDDPEQAILELDFPDACGTVFAWHCSVQRITGGGEVRLSQCSCLDEEGSCIVDPPGTIDAFMGPEPPDFDGTRFALIRGELDDADCELRWVEIIEMAEMGALDMMPLWAAGNVDGAPLATTEIRMKAIEGAECMCESEGCCSTKHPPGQYQLEVDTPGFAAGFVLVDEGDQEKVMRTEDELEIHNLSSHVVSECGADPNVAWVLRLLDK